jgi:phosphohistidine phosphatase
LRILDFMRRLFLVRHAKAELSVGRDDYARKLTERGRADARRVAKALAARHFLPDVLIHSGAARAKQTAEIFAAEWGSKVELEQDTRLYDASLTTLLERARALADAHKRVGLVGHNPGLGELATALTGSGAEPERRRLAAKYPTGAVAVLDFSIQRWKEVERNSGMLALYLTPTELGADAD